MTIILCLMIQFELAISKVWNERFYPDGEYNILQHNGEGTKSTTDASSLTERRAREQMKTRI